jgi:hypothetical protein
MFNTVDPTGGLSQQAIPAFTQNNDRAAQMANAGADRAQRSKEGALDRNQRGQEHQQGVQLQQQQMDLQKKQQADTLEMDRIDMKNRLMMEKAQIQQANALRRHAAESLKNGANNLHNPANLAEAVKARTERVKLQNKYAVWNLYNQTSRKGLNTASSPDGTPSVSGKMITGMVTAAITAKSQAANALVNSLKGDLVNDTFGKKISKAKHLVVDPKDPTKVRMIGGNSIGDHLRLDRHAENARFDKDENGNIVVKAVINGKEVIRTLDEDSSFFRASFSTSQNLNDLTPEDRANIVDDMSPLHRAFGAYLTNQSVENAAKPEVLDGLVQGLSMLGQGNQDGVKMIKYAVGELAKSKDEKGKEIGERAVRDMIGEALAITKDFTSREKPLAGAAMNSINLEALQNGDPRQDFMQLKTDDTPGAKNFTRRMEIGEMINKMGTAASGLMDDEGNFYLDAYHNGTFQLGGSTLANIPQARVLIDAFQMMSNEPDMIAFAQKLINAGPEVNPASFSDNPQLVKLISDLPPEQRPVLRDIATAVMKQAIAEHNIDPSQFNGLRDEDSFITGIANQDMKIENLSNSRELNAVNNATPMPDIDTSYLDEMANQIPGGR